MVNVWPYVPLLGIQETVDHMSTNLITRTTEQRLALRYWPRQTFQYVHHFGDPTTFAQAKAFAGLNNTSPVYVPAWLDAVRLPEGVNALQDTIDMDVSYGDWRNDGYAIIWESVSKYAVVQISRVAYSGFLELTAPVGLDFHQPFIIPLRTCLAKQGYQFARKANYARCTMVFSTIDNTQLIAPDDTTLEGFDVYKSIIVLPAPPHDAASINESIIRPSTYFDNGMGPQIQEASRIIDDFGMTLSFLDELGPEYWARKKFLHWIRGKVKPFWWPSYNNDLALVNPIAASDTTILVTPLATVNVYTGDEIMILMKDGTRYYRTIIGYAVDGSNHRLTISSIIGASLALADINMVCFMKKVRSNADSFTFTQSTPTLVTMTMPVLEIPE